MIEAREALKNLFDKKLKALQVRSREKIEQYDEKATAFFYRRFKDNHKKKAFGQYGVMMGLPRTHRMGFSQFLKGFTDSYTLCMILTKQYKTGS